MLPRCEDDITGRTCGVLKEGIPHQKERPDLVLPGDAIKNTVGTLEGDRNPHSIFLGTGAEIALVKTPPGTAMYRLKRRRISISGGETALISSGNRQENDRATDYRSARNSSTVISAWK